MCIEENDKMWEIEKMLFASIISLSKNVLKKKTPACLGNWLYITLGVPHGIYYWSATWDHPGEWILLGTWLHVIPESNIHI